MSIYYMCLRKVFCILFLVFGFSDIALAKNPTPTKNFAFSKGESAKVRPAEVEIPKSEVKNPYTINNIFAYGKEKNSTESRAKAMSQANRAAIAVLMDNLGISEDSRKNLTDEQIEDLVYSKQILDEKIAGNYYSAKFNIEFMKSAVNEALNVAKPAPVPSPTPTPEVTSPPELFLLFPVEIIDDKPVLWERTNSWRKNIENFIVTNNVRSLTVPTAEDIDLNDIDTKNTKEDDFAHFTSVIYRYNAKGAIIAYYEIDDIENKAEITLKTISFPDIKKIKLSFVNADNLDEGSLMAEAANRTMNYLVQNGKKPEAKTKYGPDEQINLNVEIADLENWLNIEDRIRDIPLVRDLKLLSISRNVAKITLTSNGENQNIVKLFAEYNFSLRRENGEYILSESKQQQNQ